MSAAVTSHDPGQGLPARSPRALVWRQLHWSQPLDAGKALHVLRSWAADQRSPRLILETRAVAGEVQYLLGGPLVAVLSAQRRLLTAVPDARLSAALDGRPALTTARRLRLSTRHRPLHVDAPDLVARSVLGVLTQVGRDESLVLQIVLGPRRIPLAVPNQSPSSVVRPLHEVIWYGNGGTIDGEKRSALRSKVGDHGFAATIRLGATAGSAQRRRELLLALFSALRLSEAPGVKLGLLPTSSRAVNAASSPWLWPLRLNATEVLALTAWPVGDDPLPGMPAAHPKRLPPAPGAAAIGRVIADSTVPGLDMPLTLPAEAGLHHLHLLGPTGTGKSTLLTNLICQDMADGRAVVVVDPQGDLVTEVLRRVPANRRDDVAVLDPADSQAPVGLNPLLTRGRNPEVVADSLLSIFRSLYGDSLGPRSQDILHACLLTLTRRPDASLIMLPLLLTNATFRRALTSNLHDPIALGPFWDWFERLSEAERQTAVAPIQNKLRQWLLRPSLRNVLGQRAPKLSMSQVFAERRILLVSLAQGQLGPEGAVLLGSLVVAELWQATTERSTLPASQRSPVMVYLDEFSAFLHLPTDLADALARSRGMGVGYTLAHQFLSQLTPGMRAAVLANTRSRICFQLAPEDAVTIARSQPELQAEDLTVLPRYEVYASLFASGQVTPFASGRTHPAPSVTGSASQLRALSRRRYGHSSADLEQDFARLIDGQLTRDHEGAGDQSAPGRARRRPA